MDSGRYRRAMTHQTQSMVPQRTTRDEVLARLTRIEIAAWVGLGVSVITLGIVVYWTIAVYHAIHAMQQAMQGFQ